MSLARQWCFKAGPFIGGADFYTYQVAIGVSAVYWPCLWMPTLRLHLGPLKLWLGISILAAGTPGGGA